VGRFEIVSGLAAILAVSQIVADRGKIDNAALVLLGVAAVGFLLPEILSTARGIGGLKRIKVGQFEAEFEQQIREAEENIIKAELGGAGKKPEFHGNIPPLHKSYVEEYERVISSPANNREKIILGGLLVERMAAETVQHLGLEMHGLHSAQEFVRRLKSEGCINEKEVEAFNSFWKVRNTAVHSAKDELTDEQTTRILDLLWRLVRVFG